MIDARLMELVALANGVGEELDHLHRVHMGEPGHTGLGPVSMLVSGGWLTGDLIGELAFTALIRGADRGEGWVFPKRVFAEPLLPLEKDAVSMTLYLGKVTVHGVGFLPALAVGVSAVSAWTWGEIQARIS